jgi:hypothetical protein
MAKLLLIVGLAVLVPASAAQAIIVEAESYVASYNIGGNPIYIVSCSYASGGLAVDGFDTPGEWIEVAVSIPEIYGYADSLRSAGDTGIQSDLRATIFGADPYGGDVISNYHTVGQGIG